MIPAAMTPQEYETKCKALKEDQAKGLESQFARIQPPRPPEPWLEKAKADAARQPPPMRPPAYGRGRTLFAAAIRETAGKTGIAPRDLLAVLTHFRYISPLFSWVGFDEFTDDPAMVEELKAR